MKAFWEGIAWLFEKVLFVPHNLLRTLELESWYGWFLANAFNWIFMGICAYYMVYWVKQLQLHEDNNEENQDTTAHSFLK